MALGQPNVHRVRIYERFFDRCIRVYTGGDVPRSIRSYCQSTAKVSR